MNTTLIFCDFDPPRYLVRESQGQLGFARRKDASSADLWLPCNHINAFDYAEGPVGPWLRYRTAVIGVHIPAWLAEEKGLKGKDVPPF